MADWETLARGMRYEALYGDRVVLCHPERPRNIHELLESAVAARSHSEAIVSGQFRLTWADIGDRSAGLSGWLTARGVASGDRVVLLLTNDWLMVVALFAIARIGSIAVPVSVKVSKAELEHVLQDSAATALLYNPALEAAVPQSGRIDTLRVCEPCDAAHVQRMIDSPGAPLAYGDEQEPALIIYTSGTTGRPKGAVISHVNVIHSVLNYSNCLELTAADRLLAAVPMSNISGVVALILTATRAQAALVVMGEFQATRFLALAAAERISYTLLVPAMYNLLLLQPDLGSWDLSSWHTGAYGAAPMPLPTIERLARTLPKLRLVNVYGATETTSPATMLPSVYAAKKPTSAGLPVPGCELMIANSSGRQQKNGEIGEIWIKGPMVAKGYWNNPTATDREFIGGFWKSGDLGSVDDEGFLYVRDREKDMINRGGYKVFSAEVETQIAAHPDVAEAAVVARECPVLGERVHAVVTLRQGARADESELAAFVAVAIADYKRPESWTVSTQPLPRNANGKVIKSQLRAQLTPYPLRTR